MEVIPGDTAQNVYITAGESGPGGEHKAPLRFNVHSRVPSNAFSSSYRKAATARMCSRSSVDMCLCAHQRILDTLQPVGLQRQFLLTYCETHTCAEARVCAQMQYASRLGTDTTMKLFAEWNDGQIQYVRWSQGSGRPLDPGSRLDWINMASLVTNIF